ncbi:hypothetical protein, partial [Klebsiella pneumoniae]|uniref:hypothetical protein n=1 Tax=Klebsiella pneumoniae TaxID=573 RepID=UPI001CDA3552
ELLDRIVGAIAFRQFPFAVIFPNIVQIHLPLLLLFERFYPRTQTDFNRCTNFVPKAAATISSAKPPHQVQ